MNNRSVTCTVSILIHVPTLCTVQRIDAVQQQIRVSRATICRLIASIPSFCLNEKSGRKCCRIVFRDLFRSPVANCLAPIPLGDIYARTKRRRRCMVKNLVSLSFSLSFLFYTYFLLYCCRAPSDKQERGGGENRDFPFILILSSSFFSPILFIRVEPSESELASERQHDEEKPLPPYNAMPC